MATKFVYSEERRFECRDCPARCCRVPWSIRFSEQEAERYLDDEWVRERAGPRGVEVLRQRTLPFRESAGRLQCTFLDDDELCSLQKRFGHDYLPRSCQVFPYGFVRSEKGEAIVALSQLCPSVQKNRGNPIKGQLAAKLRELGKAEGLAPRMGSRNGPTLKPRHYLRVIARWAEVLQGAESPAQALADLYDWTDLFEDNLPSDSDAIDNSAVDSAIEKADRRDPVPLTPRRKASFQARNLYGYQLGNLCYPSRLLVQHRVGRLPPLSGVKSWFNKIAWFLEWGTVDLLFVDQPVRLHHVKRVDRFLGDEYGQRLIDHLLETLERRHVLTEQRYLVSVLVDLAMGTAVASRFARCRASADGRTSVNADDVSEGRGVADFVLLSHMVSAEEGKLMRNLRQLLLSRREDFRELLAGEI